jgi:hypothetical protein
MKRLICAVFLLAAAPSAQAEPITVRSGEHADFSRLVIDFATTVDWREERDGRRHRLIFPASDLTLSTDRVFSKIPRTRLSDLTWGAGTLTLDLSCDCTVRTERLASGKLVIDITDKPYVPAPTEAKSRDTPKDIRFAREMFDKLTEPPAVAPPLEPMTVADIDLAGPAAVLAQEIGRAASQGLLAAAPTGLDTIPASAPLDNGLPGFELRNALDAHTIDPRENTVDEISICQPAAVFDVAHWGGEEPAGELIGRARNKLVGEFDLHNADDVTAFAKRLLFLGFGAEARATLNALDGDPDPVLRTLSYIVDGDIPADLSLIEDQISCDTAGALWATLAVQSVPASGALNAILREFSALPDHHRIFLGPKLIRAFLQSDLPEQAHQIRNAIHRSADQSEPQHVMDAEIALHGSDAEEGRALLRDIALRDNHEATQALDILLHAPDTPADTHLAQTAVVYAAEFPKTAEADRLLNGAISAFLANGDYPAAFDAVNGLGPSARAHAYTAIWAHLVAQGTDASFLQILYTPALADTRSGWSDALVLDAHSRLTALGFADEADGFWPSLGQVAPTTPETPSVLEPTPPPRQDATVFNSDRAKEILSQSNVLSEKVEEILRN